MNKEKLLAQYGQLTLQAKLIASQINQIEQVLLQEPKENENEPRGGDSSDKE